ncbi:MULTISPECIES: hypothetical protein [Cupriavidus]|uniref:hypothetical protein n=1 Tax=Cupriavidus TaxID=106589 RepID=UPI001559786F|nr:hypothetical protein [Cupriavidus taiwanensis]
MDLVLSSTEGSPLACCNCACRLASSSAKGLLKQAALLGAHLLGLGSELPCLESRQFEGDLLDLDVLELDLAFLLLDVCEPLLVGERMLLRFTARMRPDELPWFSRRVDSQLLIPVVYL